MLTNMMGLSRQALKIMSLSLGITVVGTLGYSWIEGWDLFDSLYMTVITLTTTGYREVHPLSDPGRLFTIVFLIGGVTSIALASTKLLDEFFTNIKVRRKKRMERKISRMKKHTIVLGFGRMGQSVCEELARAEHPFVVIERNEEKQPRLEKLGYQFVMGDADSDENLKIAGIEKASHLVCVVDSEAAGLFAAVAARALNPSIEITVRADTETTKNRMKLAGVNRVVLPYVMTGRKIAHQVMHPEMADFLELSVGGSGDKRLQLVDLEIDASSPYLNKSLRDSGFPREGQMVVGIKRANSDFQFAPDPDLVVELGDKLVTIGTVQQ